MPGRFDGPIIFCNFRFLMTEKILTILLSSSIPLWRPLATRHCAPHGDRVGLHSAAFGTDHAVCRLPGFYGQDEVDLGGYGWRDWLQSRSLVAYEIGCYGGRPLVESYGRWILMGRRELDWADRFFQRWDTWPSLSRVCCR